MTELQTNPTMATMPTAHWSVVPAAVETTAADPIAADRKDVRSHSDLHVSSLRAWR